MTAVGIMLLLQQFHQILPTFPGQASGNATKVSDTALLPSRGTEAGPQPMLRFLVGGLTFETLWFDAAPEVHKQISGNEHPDIAGRPGRSRSPPFTAQMSALASEWACGHDLNRIPPYHHRTHRLTFHCGLRAVEEHLASPGCATGISPSWRWRCDRHARVMRGRASPSLGRQRAANASAPHPEAIRSVQRTVPMRLLSQPSKRAGKDSVNHCPCQSPSAFKQGQSRRHRKHCSSAFGYVRPLRNESAAEHGPQYEQRFPNHFVILRKVNAA
jgi:hypothetical protein